MNTLIKGTEAACGTDAAGASTFGSATVVRLVNNSATARLVTVIDEVGGSTTIGTFTLPGNKVEFVVPVKNTRPVATGVQPIKRKRGEVIQDNYQHK